MKTLYVTDLDGTLLRSDQKTSAYTNEVINRLVDRGVLFSYATARSYHTSHKVTAGMTAAFPLIVYNGVFVRDNATGKTLISNILEKDSATAIIKKLISSGIQPIVYSLINDEEKFSYIKPAINRATQEFIDTRKGDRRDRPVSTIEELLEGDPFYITCIDEPSKLAPFNELYKNDYHCVYQSDIYSGEQWLEIMSPNACKSAAARQLMKLLDCDRLVVFGDGMNDTDMFMIADESYAVSNAVPELKNIATGVIGSNDEDGVARWLEANVRD